MAQTIPKGILVLIAALIVALLFGSGAMASQTGTSDLAAAAVPDTSQIAGTGLASAIPRSVAFTSSDGNLRTDVGTTQFDSARQQLSITDTRTGQRPTIIIVFGTVSEGSVFFDRELRERAVRHAVMKTLTSVSGTNAHLLADCQTY